jgi:hypothetical protein
MNLHDRRWRNVCILLIGLSLPGCGSVQRAILDATAAQGDVTNTIPEEQSGANSPASANASANPAETPAPPSAARPSASPEIAVRETSCNRAKVISVGMTVAQVYRSCWGKPKSVNISVMGSTKTEMLLYDGYNYVYAENGIVKSIETSGR